MKNSLKIIISVLLYISSNMSVNAQTYQTLKDCKQPPKNTEIVVDVIKGKSDGGGEYDKYDFELRWKNDKEGRWVYSHRVNYIKTFTEEDLIKELMSLAKKEYGDQYPKFSLRNFESKRVSFYYDKGPGAMRDWYQYTYEYSATVVIPNPKALAKEELPAVLDRALSNVREGSRLAIDQLIVQNGTDRGEYKDLLIDVLLDKGYKVVAKEYLERLYEEQQQQQSGIYNDNTTVKDNNFSAVGYYLNVKVTETTLRVQVINVSTGEYESNTIVNF